MSKSKTNENCLRVKVRLKIAPDLEDVSKGVLSPKRGVKLKISFILHAGRIKAEGEVH